MTTPTGEVQLSQRFTPFGEVKEKYGDGEATFGYTAQKYDAQTGLLYLRARYYAPGMGRFISHDTWAGDVNMPMSYNKWLYGYGNPLRYFDPTGFYNRQVAVQWARNHDLMDPYPEGVAYRTLSEGGYMQTDCTAFASSVISRGGIVDGRAEKPTYTVKANEGTVDEMRKYDDYSEPIPYWDRELAEREYPYYLYENYNFESWMNTQRFYEFLTEVKLFDSFEVSTANLSEELQNHVFDIGDLVFYKPVGRDYMHVAIISEKWAPQTFYGSFLPFPGATNDDYPITWTRYLVDPELDACEYKTIFEKMAYERANINQTILQSNPNSFSTVPRVVERSGAILYSGSRSINDTISHYDSVTIVHIP